MTSYATNLGRSRTAGLCGRAEGTDASEECPEPAVKLELVFSQYGPAYRINFKPLHFLGLL